MVALDERSFWSKWRRLFEQGSLHRSNRVPKQPACFQQKRLGSSLMNYLGVPIGLPRVIEPWTTRFKVAPRFLEDVSAAPAFEDDPTWSRVS